MKGLTTLKCLLKEVKQTPKTVLYCGKRNIGPDLALQHFEVYVTSGQLPVEVFTDHNPLTFLSKIESKDQSLTRWSLFLQEYNLDVKHIPGEQNLVADALSRC